MASLIWKQGIPHKRMLERLDRLGYVSFIHPFVKFGQCAFQIAPKQHVMVALAPKCAIQPKLFLIEAALDVPSKFREQLACWFLHGLFFGITVLGHDKLLDSCLQIFWRR